MKEEDGNNNNNNNNRVPRFEGGKPKMGRGKDSMTCLKRRP